MEIHKIDVKTKCDFIGCKNLANIVFVDALDKKKKMCFCENCINSLYQCYAKTITPKPIEAPFKRKKY